jgi:hypothetical protein
VEAPIDEMAWVASRFGRRFGIKRAHRDRTRLHGRLTSRGVTVVVA